MSAEGFRSQLTKLDKRFGEPGRWVPVPPRRPRTVAGASPLSGVGRLEVAARSVRRRADDYSLRRLAAGDAGHPDGALAFLYGGRPPAAARQPPSACSTAVGTATSASPASQSGSCRSCSRSTGPSTERSISWALTASKRRFLDSDPCLGTATTGQQPPLAEVSKRAWSRRRKDDPHCDGAGRLDSFRGE